MILSNIVPELFNLSSSMTIWLRCSGLTFRSKRVKVAEGSLEAAMGKIIGGDKQAKHAAVKEAQTPVVILINLQEADVLRILLIDLIKVRPAKQLERIHTLGAS